MSINYKEYVGDMCGKCIYMNMKDCAGYMSNRYRCNNGEGYISWSGNPCSKYEPDYSDSRIRVIDAGREGRL